MRDQNLIKRVRMIVGLATFSFTVLSCGPSSDKKDDDPASDVGIKSGGVVSSGSGDALGQNPNGASSNPGAIGPLSFPSQSTVSVDLESVIQNESLIYSYLQSALESTVSNPNSQLTHDLDGSYGSNLVDQSGVFLAANSMQSTSFPACTTDGLPYDSSLQRMGDPTGRSFAQTAFYCQLNASDTRITVRGALEQNRRLLCDVERTLGSLAYQPNERIYSNVTLSLTTGCGWTSQDLTRLGKSSFVGVVKTQTLSGSSWQKKLVLEFPGAFDVTLFVTVTKTSLSFKEIQGWKRTEEKEANEYLAQNAVGIHGHVIHLDYATGTLRAETADTYWGRRVRLYARGELEPNTGRFKRVDAMSGVVSRFNKGGDEGKTYIDNAVASVTGDSVGGFAYRSAIYHCPMAANCNPNNEELFKYTILNQSPLVCIPLTAKCTNNQGISFGLNSETLGFLMIGAAWDDQGSRRSQFDTWLRSASIPNFTSIGLSTVLP